MIKNDQAHYNHWAGTGLALVKRYQLMTQNQQDNHVCLVTPDSTPGYAATVCGMTSDMGFWAKLPRTRDLGKVTCPACREGRPYRWGWRAKGLPSP